MENFSFGNIGTKKHSKLCVVVERLTGFGIVLKIYMYFLARRGEQSFQNCSVLIIEGILNSFAHSFFRSTS